MLCFVIEDVVELSVTVVSVKASETRFEESCCDVNGTTDGILDENTLVVFCSRLFVGAEKIGFEDFSLIVDNNLPWSVVEGVDSKLSGANMSDVDVALS